MQWWCVATAEAWTGEWRAYPGVWLFILFFAVAGYAWAKRFGGTVRRGYFFTSIALFWIALDWPVGALGAGYLASIHMVQFLLIAMIAPAFFLLSVPEERWERMRERESWFFRTLTHPIPAIGIFTSIVALTHWPPVVDGLMASQLGNFVLDISWLAVGILFWWPVCAGAPARSWVGPPAKMGYLIAASLLNTGVFAYLTFTELPLYATFELAPPIGWISSRDDQIMAGLFMKMGGGVILWTAITIIFFRWFAAEGDNPLTPIRAES